ncbi:MAG: peptidoglycan DD-metalloendopeptidase family protein [bacterium]|nr:peptidoglycan DD-metalloendopeptidase family protein [bacterium]MYH55248.1 peptidoglycan DD-metalloendopeptidase family protein [Acidimicrobiia bacterium]
MHRRRLVGIGGAVALGAFLLVPVMAGAQPEEERLADVERQMSEMARLIESTQAERTEFVQQIEVLEARLASQKTDLWAAEEQAATAAAAVAVSEDAFNNLTRRIRLADAELVKTRLDQDETRVALRDRTVEMYMTGTNGIDVLLAGAWDPGSDSIRLEYARGLLEDIDLLLRTLQILERQELERQEALLLDRESEAELLVQLRIEQLEAQQYRADVEAVREDLFSQLEEMENLLAAAGEEIDDYEGHVAALEAESQEIELAILRRQVREGEVPGVLAWPVSGGVTSPFGWRIHPIFGDRRLHTGIDLRARAGEPIYAAANGAVLLAEARGGYGQTVILSHGGGLTTLYAHLSRIGVSADQIVNAGDVVGYVGCTGFCTGPHLHFEVREVGNPVDPMTYLPG